MPQFIETIRIEQGQAHHLDLHQQRINRTLAKFYPHSHFSLSTMLPHPLPMERCKWRIVYGEEVVSTSLELYNPRSIETLRLLNSQFSYEYKFLNRTAIDNAFAQRGDADDVLFLHNGFITDTSIFNVAFFDGLHWLTPASPLLKGTMRHHLIDLKVIFEAELNINDLTSFSQVSLFNALNPWGEIVLGISSIQDYSL